VWYQLHIELCHKNGIDVLSEALEETGALSITLTDKNDDPVLEPEPGTTPLWPDIIVNALYAEEADALTAQIQLTTDFPNLQISRTTLADQDWERAWMDDFKPQSFGSRLWICPSWSTPPNPDAINLILDPGLAFGTGTHPTTSLCLQWLDKAHLQGKTVIDYGCGSGILALAALKLGAASVHAVDIDPQALQATQNNAESNDLLNNNQLVMGYPNELNTCVDLIIANILLSPLMSLRQRFHALLNPAGMLVVSGILTEQVDQLIEEYHGQFTHQDTISRDGWSLILFKRA